MHFAVLTTLLALACGAVAGGTGTCDPSDPQICNFNGEMLTCSPECVSGSVSVAQRISS